MRLSVDQELRCLSPGIWRIAAKKPGRSVNPLKGSWSGRADHLYRFPGTIVLQTDEFGLVAVDPGPSVPGVYNQRVEMIRHLEWLTATPLGALGVTHAHLDHSAAINRVSTTLPIFVGNLAWSSTELVGPDGLLVREQTAADRGGLVEFPRWQHGVVFKLYRLLAYGPVGTIRPERCQVYPPSFTVKGREVLVLPAPGHTPDEVMFWDDQFGVLIAGDIFGTTLRRITTPSAYLPRADVYAMQKTLIHMRQYKPRLLVVAHGQPVEGQERIRTTIDTVARNLDTIVSVSRRLYQRFRSNTGERLDAPQLLRLVADQVFQPSVIDSPDLPEISQQERLHFVMSAVFDL